MSERESMTALSLSAAVPPRQASSRWRNFFHLFGSFFQIAQPTSLDLPFTIEEIARFHHLVRQNSGNCLDDQTWKDLELGDYLDSLSSELSIFGQQSLYHRLRAGADSETLTSSRARMTLLANDSTLLVRLCAACRPLRETATEISSVLFGETVEQTPGWSKLAQALPFFTVAALAFCFVTPYAWFAAALGFILPVVAQLEMHEKIEHWKYTSAALQKLLVTSEALASIPKNDGALRLQSFTEGRERMTRLYRSIAPPPYLNMPLVSAYANWIFLSNVRHYFNAQKQLKLHSTFLQQCFIEAGRLEADIALVRHLNNLTIQQQFCWAKKGEAGSLELTDVVNPLLPGAARISVKLQAKGIFLSGQNGAGKSTLLRTVGLNLASARAFGFCYTSHAELPVSDIQTSIQIEDSLAAGESLYMAELRRARELLAYAQGPAPCILIIDEIFRGTNHMEGVSAAAAVLHTLAKHSLLIVSSHNLVLAPLLSDSLLPYHIKRAHGHENDALQLSLTPGVLSSTNGIAMLSSSDFGPDIPDIANRIYSWLNTCIGDPAQATVPPKL
ncbi:MutS-related protein [Undibacterium sp. TJN25]|uniref:MutS-related protein n=1 Tax=Undibacterium sp. TJN25 TaxID=3413056 RepID=UPI003BF1F689